MPYKVLFTNQVAPCVKDGVFIKPTRGPEGLQVDYITKRVDGAYVVGFSLPNAGEGPNNRLIKAYCRLITASLLPGLEEWFPYYKGTRPLLRGETPIIDDEGKPVLGHVWEKDGKTFFSLQIDQGGILVEVSDPRPSKRGQTYDLFILEVDKETTFTPWGSTPTLAPEEVLVSDLLQRFTSESPTPKNKKTKRTAVF